MNLNDYRLNAYKTAAKKSDTSNEDATLSKTSKTSKVASTKQIEKIKEAIDLKTVKKSDNFEPDPQLKIATEALTQGGLLKIPEAEKGKENVYRRVAKFLILIGVDSAAEVLKHLSQEETEKIIPEITAVRKIEPEEATSILEEFNSVLERVKEGGGTHTAQLILEKAFGKQRSQDLMNRLNIQEEEKPFSYLAEKQPEQILQLLKDEANNTRAVVFSYLPPKKAADCINKLSDKDKKEVILNLAQTKKVMPDIIKRLDKVIHEKSLAQIDVKTNSIDGKSVLAEILKKMDFKAEQDILATLKNDDPALGDELQEKLFTVDDVLNSDDKFIQNYLRELTDTEIAYLVADKDSAFRDKIFNNMSSGRSLSVSQEEEIRKPMLKKDCNEITQKFYSHLRHAWERGELRIKGRDEDEYIE